jgi:hypothetical protein
MGTLVADRQGRRGRALCAVHGQGQRALPHAVLPGHDPRIGRAVEARRLHQVVQLPELRRRPVLDLQGRGVFMDQALSILPADYWRWWLLSHAPESSDSEFTWENFQASVNKDLADVLGNFVSRVTKFCRSKLGRGRPRGRPLRRGRGRAHRRPRHAHPPLRAPHGGDGGPQGGGRAARDLGDRQRIPPVRRALVRPQGRPRPRRRHRPPVAQPHPRLRGPLRALHPRRGGGDADRAAHRRPLLARRRGPRAGEPPRGPRLHRAGGALRQDHRRTAGGLGRPASPASAPSGASPRIPRAGRPPSPSPNRTPCPHASAAIPATGAARSRYRSSPRPRRRQEAGSPS